MKIKRSGDSGVFEGRLCKILDGDDVGEASNLRFGAGPFFVRSGNRFRLGLNLGGNCNASGIGITCSRLETCTLLYIGDLAIFFKPSTDDVDEIVEVRSSHEYRARCQLRGRLDFTGDMERARGEAPARRGGFR